MSRRLLLLLAPLLLAGCGTFADPTGWFGDDPHVIKPAELSDVADEIHPRVLWSRDVGAGSGGQSLGLRPAIDAGRVYVADGEGLVQALDAASGNTLWSRETGLNITGGPGAGDGLVVVGTDNGDLLALDDRTGEERWRIQLSSEVLSAPAVGMGMVVVHTHDSKLYGLKAATGEQLWRHDREQPILTLHGSSSPLISGGVVYCGMTGGKLVAFDVERGVPVWEVNVSVASGRSELERLVDIDGDPLLYNGVVYAATYQGVVAAVSESSGNFLWERKLSSHRGLAVDWRQLYAADEEGSVWAMDPDTGAARWRNQQLAHRDLSAPAVVGGYAVVGDYDGYLHWLAPEDGHFAARTRAGGGRISAPPQVANGVLYVLDDGGELSAISLSSQ